MEREFRHRVNESPLRCPTDREFNLFAYFTIDFSNSRLNIFPSACRFCNSVKDVVLLG